MNVRTIALAITLIVPAAAVFAAEDIPYTGPNKPVMTTAANDVVTQEVYGWRNTAGRAPGDNAGFKMGSGYTSSAEKVAVIKDAPINRENHGWQIIVGKDKTPAMNYAPTDKTLGTAGKGKVLEAVKDAPINTPTAN